MMRLTVNYGLKKPEGSDVVNIDDFNYNADIIDSTLKGIKNEVGALELKAEKVTVADSTNVFTATNVEGVLLELLNKIKSNTSNISRHTTTLSEHTTKMQALETELGTNKATLQNNINAIREVL